MPKSLLSLVLLLALAGLYLTSLGGVGFLGPDEPRYASIGRAMAESGDWITPRLDGEAWFEKPPLLYWLTGAGNLLGLPDEWAARLPLALISLAFLMFFYQTLEREFSQRIALVATSILATSAGWVSYTFAAVTDLPMTAALNAAMLVALFGTSAISTRDPRRSRHGYVAGALLGLAVLAKGLVPLVLFVPAFLIARGKRTGIVIATVAVAAPWYILCAAQNGPVFWQEFFWKHHVERFFQSGLEHVQPFWYYVPVILAGLFPWTPLIALLGRRKIYEDARIPSFLLFVLYGLIFFSVSRNKLPGYVLPLMPSLAIALAAALGRIPSSRWWLSGCAILLAAVPVIAGILPEALRDGITHTSPSVALGWPFLLMAGAVWWLAWSEQQQEAVLAVALAAVAAVVYLKLAVFAPLDRQVSARGFYRANEAAMVSACVDPELARDWVYGLSYYSGREVAECRPGQSPRVVETESEVLQILR